MDHGRGILAVVVLYRRSAEKSESFGSMRRLLTETPAWASEIELMICDNSPQTQQPPADFRGLYLRDPSNAGLAHSYNQALRRAQEENFTWLMLLDQDTTLTAEYLDEVVESTGRLDRRTEVVALVPKLVQAGSICSPAHPPRYGPARAIDERQTGSANTHLHAFNSGAVLRVSALHAIGGFPPAFPLDYLDHATFTKLQRNGGQLYLLRSRLEHELSSNSEAPADDASARRRAGVLDAERRFYKTYGSSADRLLRRVRLLRAVLGRVLRGREAGQTWRMLKSALRP